MLKWHQKVTENSGVEWLLENDPALNKSHTKITNLGGYARRVAEFQDRSCGSVRLEEEDELMETLAAPASEEIEAWRTVQLGESMEELLDLLREEGVAGLARRMNCTSRSIQQKLKKLVDGGVDVDLLTGEVA